MEATFTTTGALIGLALAILLIIKKVHPAYSLILGALVGGLIGGGDLVTIVNTMVLGAQGMMSSILRILTSGILAGALIKTGSAEKIAESIIKKLGQQRAITALAIATMIICAVGVFIDIAVITVAPIALAIGKKANLSKSSILLAMIGGGKAGNIISPNPNTIAASEAFKVDLTSLMVQNIIPAIAALVVTIILAKIVSKKNNDISYDSEEQVGSDLPAFLPAISGPLVVICLLALRPLFGITIDPLIALPLGGLISILATDYYIQVLDYLWKHRKKYDSLITYLEEAFPTDYYRALIPSDVVVAQKPGYVREALNVGAIVKEEVPYIVAIYTAGLGGSTQEDSEINGVGLYQLEQLCFVINQWHRVNMN